MGHFVLPGGILRELAITVRNPEWRKGSVLGRWQGGLEVVLHLRVVIDAESFLGVFDLDAMQSKGPRDRTRWWIIPPVNPEEWLTRGYQRHTTQRQHGRDH